MHRCTYIVIGYTVYIYIFISTYPLNVSNVYNNNNNTVLILQHKHLKRPEQPGAECEIVNNRRCRNSE